MSTDTMPPLKTPQEWPGTRFPCRPSDGLGFVCGPNASEDLAWVPESHWIVLSGLNIGPPGRLYVLDDRTKHASILFPTDRPAVRCDDRHGEPGQAPPDPERMSTSGINIRVSPAGECLLYACNHGDRHAIEIFEIEIRDPVPTATWVGCIPLPAGTLAAGVVPLRDGGVLVSSFYDPRDDEAWARMARREPTGSLWEWHAASGFRQLQTGGISGANGLEVSHDERTIYASAWSASELLILDRFSGSLRRVPLDFLPDNIKRAASGCLFIAGQRSTVGRIAACKGPNCPQDWIVVRFDPSNDQVLPLVARPGNELINYACAAMEVNGTLYITARGDRRVAYIPVAGLPSLRTAHG
jgi:hypothetical protein